MTRNQALRNIEALAMLVTGLLFLGGKPAPSFREFLDAHTKRIVALGVEEFTMDMREEFKNVPDDKTLQEQAVFFSAQQQALAEFDRGSLASDEQLLFDLVAYQIDFHQQRVALTLQWSGNGRPLPQRSLHELPAHELWYALFVRRFTGTDITPQQVFALGESETRRCLREIDKIRRQLGIADSSAFRAHLSDPRFMITDKQKVIAGFGRIDSTVRSHLKVFVGDVQVPVVEAREWPNAGPSTPPGIYRPRDEHGTGTDQFHINFHGGAYNSRAMEWIYMHEAIPGHHLQVSVRRGQSANDLRDELFFPGTAEGWACYVEYYGDDLGLYTDPYQRLGKWEWDLVRSVRLVLDAGIHYHGWSHQQALDYWLQHIPGQDAIAEREVTRVTNWAAQALSYKVGADRIQRMRDALQHEQGPRFNAARFHRAYLHMGQVPIAVAEGNIRERLQQ
ncbi:MAG: DUF885 domain-containing protein [Flavobacteriales bacterium]|nr:DUF885 domain-containing protein [Flavobacteriales bacterium]